LQEDPHPGILSLTKTVLNRYIYSGNNPLNLKDPSGRSFLKNLGKALVVAAIVVAAVYTGGAVFAAVSTSVGSTVAGASIVTGTVGYGAAAAAIGAAAGAAIGMAAAIAAGATVGAIIGASGFGAIEQVSGGNFGDGARQGGKIGFVLGGISGGLGAGYGFGPSEAPGSIGSFIANNPYLFATPALILPATGEFNIEYQCGVANPKDFIFGTKSCDDF